MTDIVERLRHERDVSWLTVGPKMLTAASEIESLRAALEGDSQ